MFIYSKRVGTRAEKMEDNTPEETEEEKEIAFLNKCIERSQTLVNSYGDAIYALQKSIEEETISINKLRNNKHRVKSGSLKPFLFFS